MAYLSKDFIEKLLASKEDLNKILGFGFYDEPIVLKKSTSTGKLSPKHVLINGDYTTVVWEDDTSTVVKKAPDDQYDFNTAILYAVLKKAAGNNSSALNRYLKIFKDKAVIKKPKEGSK